MYAVLRCAKSDIEDTGASWLYCLASVWCATHVAL